MKTYVRRVGLDALPPQERRWPHQALGTTVAGIGAWGVLPLIGQCQYANVSLVGGIAMSAACTATGVRNARRQERLDNLVVSLVKLQGLRVPDRNSLRATKWSRHWNGVPARVEVAFAPGALTNDPKWHADLEAKATAHLCATYTIKDIDTRRCVAVLEADPNDLANRPTPETARVKAIAPKLFGAGTTATCSLDDDGELAAFTVSLPNPEKFTRQHPRLGLENSITALLPGRWRGTWDLQNDTVTFDRRHELSADPIPRKARPLDQLRKDRIWLAVDEDLNDVYWDLSGSGPHLLVVGKTGTGKTVAINGAVMEIARLGFQIFICDPKSIEFLGLRTWPNVSIVAMTVIEMIATIKHVHDEMERRYAAIRDDGADESDFEPLFLILDEFRNFYRQATAWYNSVKVRGMPAKCEVFEWIGALAEKARSAKIHLVIGTQRPDAAFLEDGMRDNIDTRISVGRLSPQGAMMMWDSAYLGTAVPRGIRGRGTAVTSDERISEIQVLWTPDPRRARSPEDLAILKALRPASASHPCLEVDLGPESDLDGKPIPAWARVLEARLVQAATPLDLTKSAGPTAAQLLGRAKSEVLGVVPDWGSEESEMLEIGAGYGAVDAISASGIRIGDVLYLDGEWVTVEAVDIDVDDQVVIGWRDDGGVRESTSLPDSNVYEIRRPLDDVETDDEHIFARAA